MTVTVGNLFQTEFRNYEPLSYGSQLNPVYWSPMTKLCRVLNVSDGENDLHIRKAVANMAY
jgi:hypothetical protein